MAVKRTFGWVQNPGDLKKLKKVVGIFKAGSAENLDLVSNKLPLVYHFFTSSPIPTDKPHPAHQCS